MSKQDKVTEKPEQKEEKVITRYDRKVQKRKEKQEKEKKEKKIATIIGVIVVAVLVCLAASFPIRTYLAVNENYVTIDGEKVTRVEFDYNYNLARNSYMSQYGSYMSYFGVNLSGDLSAQMFSETLTWKDYFEQMAVENITNNKAMLREAKATGFSYDTKEEYKEYEASLKDQAALAGTSLNSYLKSEFGSYATLGRLSGYVKDIMIVNAYYEKVSNDKAPSDDEIRAYYDENKDEYDSVDYRLVTVNAVLPTEPTELADTETEPAEGESGEDTTYQPSEAEVAEAMRIAGEEAQEALKTVAADGELKSNQQSTDVSAVVGEWLYDASRKQGDTTVLEDTSNNRYYVVAFESRYLDETPTVDLHAIISDTMDPQAVMEEWKSGEATEDSFGQLARKYSEEEVYAQTKGLYEAVTKEGMEDELVAWLYEDGRANGDVTAITTAAGTNYVLYYIGQNEPEWKLSVKSTLVMEAMADYVEEITKDSEVVDTKGKLNYLKVQAAEEASSEAVGAESGAAQSGAEDASSTEQTDVGSQETDASGTSVSGTSDSQSSGSQTVTGE